MANTQAQARAHLATIRDPIALAHSAIGSRQVDDRDDCVSYLLEWLVRLAYRYNPDQDKAGSDFPGYATYILSRFGVTSYERSRFRVIWKFGDRTYRREKPIVLSLEGSPTSGGDPLGTTLAAWTLDTPERSDTGLARVLQCGDSTPTRVRHNGPSTSRTLDGRAARRAAADRVPQPFDLTDVEDFAA